MSLTKLQSRVTPIFLQPKQLSNYRFFLIFFFMFYGWNGLKKDESWLEFIKVVVKVDSIFQRTNQNNQI